MRFSKLVMGGTHRSAFKIRVTTMWASLVFLIISGGWSPARAVGPALWIASPEPTGITGAVGGLVELRPAQLTQSGKPHQVRITEPGLPLANAAGIAFQPNGNLWVTTLNNTLLKFTPLQLNNLSIHPHPIPAASITSSSFMLILGCLFDTQVNLWIVDPVANAVHEISHAQLANGTANLTPAATIIDATDLASAAFAIFDKAGNLWISSEGNSQLVEFANSQLASSGSPIPNLVFSSPSLNAPGQMEFDSAGNLWVANSGNSTIVEFTPYQLASSDNPAAAVVLGDDGSGSLSTPWGLQFDSLHRLWVCNYATGTISKFGPGELMVSGSPVPRVFLTGLPLFAAQIAFGPSH